jgi:hypothetical protein
MAMWLAAHGQAPPRDESAWSPELSAFVVRCFEPDPARRALARELLQEIRKLRLNSRKEIISHLRVCSDK